MRALSSLLAVLASVVVSPLASYGQMAPDQPPAGPSMAPPGMYGGSPYGGPAGWPAQAAPGGYGAMQAPPAMAAQQAGYGYPAFAGPPPMGDDAAKYAAAFPKGGPPEEPYVDMSGVADQFSHGGAEEPFHKYWVKVDYLLWSGSGDDLPPLVTTSPIGTDQLDAGVLGREDTEILFGNESVHDDIRSGTRISVGFWVVAAEYQGYEAYYMTLLDEETNFSASSTFSTGGTGQILVRPFFDVQADQQSNLIVAFPQFIQAGVPVDFDGSITVDTHSSVESAGALRRDLLWLDRVNGWRAFMLTGYRYFSLDEDLRIANRTEFVGGFFAPGSRLDAFDSFDTENEFHGLDLGIDAEFCYGRWSVEMLSKIAFGNSHGVVDIRGSTFTFDGLAASRFEGGLLTQPTNIGSRSENEFAVLPEFGLTLGCQVTQRIKATVGYSALWYSTVVRPGDQIDLGVNPTQFEGGTLVGDERPAPRFEHTDYFMHGLTAGLEFRW